MTRQEFEYLYDSYVSAVARFLSNYTKNTDQLEDWVQIVFLKLWKYRDNVDINGEYLKTYLLKTARNVALTELKKERQNILVYQPDLHAAAEPARIEELPAHNRNAQQREDTFMEKYQNALDKVPPRAHEVYQLSREKGLSYQEIADTLQISPKTVEVHISKVLRILRKELEEYKR